MVEAAPTTAPSTTKAAPKLVIGTQQSTEENIIQVQPGQASLVLGLLQPKSLCAIETASQAEPL